MPTVAKINKASSLSSDLCLYKLGEPRFEVLPVPFSYWHPLGFAWGGKKQRSKVTEFDTEAKVLIIAGIVSCLGVQFYFTVEETVCLAVVLISPGIR